MQPSLNTWAVLLLFAAAQGFFLARPMSAPALTEILESRRPGSEIGDARAAG